MHYHIALHTINHMALLPREVVVVLHVEQHVKPEVPGNVLMDERMIRGGVTAHQFHRRPVFLPFFGVEG